jgi:hypothetical protein
MPQRNGQNPIRAVKNFGHAGSNKFNDKLAGQPNVSDVAGKCPSCNTEIPPKPGFRLSSLKCPKCGTPAVKK